MISSEAIAISKWVWFDNSLKDDELDNSLEDDELDNSLKDDDLGDDNLDDVLDGQTDGEDMASEKRNTSERIESSWP